MPASDDLIRRSWGDRPGLSNSGRLRADVPGLSAYVESWLRPWQQCWQQPGTCLQIAVTGRQADAELGGGLAASDRDAPLMTRGDGTVILSGATGLAVAAVQVYLGGTLDGT